MIWFACKQCGKRHGRQESQIGTLVFCDCGQGNRVPWSSTAPPDDLPAAQPAPARPAPRPQPILDAEPASTPRVPADLPVPGRRPGRLLGKVNPNFCFHHDERPSQTTCEACRLPFCGDCVVSLRGKSLCGPCKNFRVGSLARPRRLLPLAIVALIVSVVSGPVTLILSLVACALFVSEGLPGASVALCLLAATLPVGGLVLSRLALQRLDVTPQAAGRSLATSAACCALVGVLWSITVAVLVVARHAM